MNDKLKEFTDLLTYWFEQNHGITATVTKSDYNTCDMALRDNDLDTDLYVGPYADPGLSIRWIGETNVMNYQGEPATQDLVLVNGIVFSAIGKHVAGWAVGLV